MGGPQREPDLTTKSAKKPLKGANLHGNASIVENSVELHGLGPDLGPLARENPCQGGIGAQSGDRTRQATPGGRIPPGSEVVAAFLVQGDIQTL